MTGVFVAMYFVQNSLGQLFVVVLVAQSPRPDDGGVSGVEVVKDIFTVTGGKFPTSQKVWYSYYGIPCFVMRRVYLSR